MEHPVAGLATHRRVPKRTPTPLINGGTSLVLSDGGPSPVFEAHPGSPVDISNRRRPSLAASLASARSCGSDMDLSRSSRSPSIVSLGIMEEGIRRDGVAAKGNISMMENAEMRSPRRMPVAGMQSFYIPAKVPENEEIQVTTTPIHGDDSASINTVMDDMMDFKFDTDGGHWISANPLAHESRSSLATTNTVTSTLMDDASRYSHGALTVDTSIASSAASFMSSAASTYSATTMSSDIYGWEEELDRKSSIENHNAWEAEMARRLPSGGRTMGSRSSRSIHRPDMKRKGLLYRVLNLRRGSEDSTAGCSPTTTEIPTTSA